MVSRPLVPAFPYAGPEGGFCLIFGRVFPGNSKKKKKDTPDPQEWVGGPFKARRVS